MNPMRTHGTRENFIIFSKYTCKIIGKEKLMSFASILFHKPSSFMQIKPEVNDFSVIRIY